MSHPGTTDQTGARKAPGQERDIYEHIELMRPVVQLYIGERDVHQLQLYLSGYCAALWVNGILEQDRPPFDYFNDWLALTRKGLEIGWAQHFLLEANGDHDVALETFFNLVAEFGNLRVVEGEHVDLPPGHRRSPEFLAAFLRTEGVDFARSYEIQVPVPTRIQLCYLRPGVCCYKRYWHGDRARDQPFLYTDAATARRAVEREFALNPADWIVRALNPTTHLEAPERGDII